ncbi:MAG: pyruvate formate lyase family protein [Ignavibacteriaceae bacterium]
MITANDLAVLLTEMTRVYRENTNNKYMREAAFLKVQQKALFTPIEKDDLFVGRTKQLPIGFLPQSDEGSLGYYIHPVAIKQLLDDPVLTAGNQVKLKEIEQFWNENSTVTKAKSAFTTDMMKALPSDMYTTESGIAFTLWRMSGVQLDYAKLVRLGIPGLRDEIRKRNLNAVPGTERWNLYQSMLKALDNLVELCQSYSNEVRRLYKDETDTGRKKDLAEMERILHKLPESKPGSFREGIQLIYIYNAADGARNYGRLDNALADLYCTDIEKEIIDKEEAIRLLSGMWRLIIDRGYRYDSRIIIGGKGRFNEEKANALAVTIIETTRRVKDIVPQLALRFNKNQDPVLYNMALDIIGEGNPYPMLYNDDVNIPSVMESFDIPENEAEHIIQFGCGEYALDHRSVGTPSGVINLLQALNVTINNGIDPVTQKLMGMPTERYTKYGEFETFDDLLKAYKEQVEYHVDFLAKHEELEYLYAGKDAAYLYSSMLMDDCIERGKGIYEGGIRYLGGTLESYGNSNTADALTAIKKLVYDEKILSIYELKSCLQANFSGYERIQKKMLNCPKYGNDNETADNMLLEVHNHLCNYTLKQKHSTSLHSYLVVVINNDANTIIGEHTSASADGRKAFAYMNPGNAPVDGMDKNGVTAFLNSIVKPDTRIHAGAVQNMKFSKEMFSEYRDKLEILLATYWQNGAAQAMLTVVGRNDLEAAMEHPELYQNLLVRVGGFSERFVNLPRHTQLEILNRTLY